MRLDGTAIKANLAIIIHQMNEMTIRKVRLLAERDGAELLQFPASLGRQLTDDGGLELIKGEDKLFQARRETLLGQRTLLQERITQIRDEITGMESQGKAILHELDLTTQELDVLRDLKKRQLVSLDRYMPLERGAAKLEGSHGQIVSDIARARGRISEAELQIIQLENGIPRVGAQRSRQGACQPCRTHGKAHWPLRISCGASKSGRPWPALCTNWPCIHGAA